MNNYPEFIDDFYDNHTEIYGNPYLFQFLTKELNGLNLGGPSSYSIESQIADLQNQLITARRREEIINVINNMLVPEEVSSSFKVNIMTNKEEPSKNICFIGTTEHFGKVFVVPQKEIKVEDTEC
jgi:hypothetical protein